MFKLEEVKQLLRIPLHCILVATEKLLQFVAAKQSQRPNRKHSAKDPEQMNTHTHS